VIEFELRSIDPVLRTAVKEPRPPAPGFTFRRTGLLDAAPAADLFLGEDAATAEARRKFATAADAAQGSPLGDVTFEDVYVAGPRGLVIDLGNRMVWCGQALGWSLASVRLEVERALVGELPDERTVLLDEALFAHPQVGDHLHLLPIPGIAVYGHWLIDLLPRLLRVGAGEIPAGAILYAPKVKRWARALAQRVGVDLAGRGLAQPGSLMRARRVDVQTLIKRRHVLDRALATAAWAALDAGLAGEADEELSSYGERLYVSRGRWKAGRALGNHQEVEAFMRGRGYSVVHPEELSLAAQREIFTRARRVVGEDGSGLHNVVFAAPGLHLTVIDLHRTNIFHASIANAKHQHVTHLQADRDGTSLSVDRLGEHLDAHP
jgi:hypothetical protein